MAAQLALDAVPAEFVGEALEWNTRYNGLVAIARLGGKAVAGISGPWDGKYALTWWERPLPARKLELFDTMDEARERVEEWADSICNGFFHAEPASAARARVADDLPVFAARPPASHESLLGQVFELFGARRSRTDEPGERVRGRRSDESLDLSNLHFAANR
ncbi:MAG: hypothetical protein EOP90_07230 [Lysobacteraceae bacterium]|nr:MAG: hypothetical protein EOP90_07230 [Xanthomonadaceae bacterium]